MKKTILSAALLALFVSVHAQERTIDEVELTGKLVKYTTTNHYFLYSVPM
jgi:hypothetical protein